MKLEFAVTKKGESGSWQQQRNWLVQRSWLNGGCGGGGGVGGGARLCLGCMRSGRCSFKKV